MNNINKNYENVLNEYKSIFNTESYTGKIFQEEGVPGVLRYLNLPNAYAVVTTAADWGFLDKNSPYLGKMGHHAIILLSGNRICEWSKGGTDLLNKEFSQEEWRIVTKGKIIEQIWKTHLELSKCYNQLGKICDIEKEGYIHYMPFYNDCFSYVNRVLKENGQKETELKRALNRLTVTELFKQSCC